MNRWPVLLATLLVVAALAPDAPDRLVAQAPPPGSYLKTFDNYVTTDPLPLGPSSDLDVLVHSRDSATWDRLEPMEAGHGPHCEAPPATHPTGGAYEDAAFICAANPHLMTAIKAGGYGLVYLTPGAMVDFSEGEAVIRFDVSTLRTSDRDWIDLWITPFDDLMAAPLGASWPDLSGVPKRSVHVDTAPFNGKTAFKVSTVNNHASTDVAGCWWCVYEDKLVPSASRRDTFELRISRTHVAFRLLNASTGLPLVTWADKDIADLGWDRGVVQIGHHSYNPEKAGCLVPVTTNPDGTTACAAPPTANTWHWDNLSISRTAPLTIIPAVERRANAAQPVYSFPEPAPADAYLQVHALATNLDYSLDDGATWATMSKQSSNVHKWGGARTYRQAIPAGTTRVTLRGTEESGAWNANHAAVYAAQAPPAPPTPVAPPPTSTPLPVETPIPTPTNPPPTPTPLPTFTPIPSTETPVPTDTLTPVLPTATATDTPPAGSSCVRVTYRVGQPSLAEEC